MGASWSAAAGLEEAGEPVDLSAWARVCACSLGARSDTGPVSPRLVVREAPEIAGFSSCASSVLSRAPTAPGAPCAAPDSHLERGVRRALADADGAPGAQDEEHAAAPESLKKSCLKSGSRFGRQSPSRSSSSASPPRQSPARPDVISGSAQTSRSRSSASSPSRQSPVRPVVYIQGSGPARGSTKSRNVRPGFGEVISTVVHSTPKVRSLSAWSRT